MMSRKNRQRSANLVVILLGLVLLVGLLSFDLTEASDQDQELLIYFPMIKNDGGIIGDPWTPSPTDRPTPTLAKTPTPIWMGQPTPTLAPTMNPFCQPGYCPPTPTPYVICLPSPCDGGD